MWLSNRQHCVQFADLGSVKLTSNIIIFAHLTYKSSPSLTPNLSHARTHAHIVKFWTKIFVETDNFSRLIPGNFRSQKVKLWELLEQDLAGCPFYHSANGITTLMGDKWNWNKKCISPTLLSINNTDGCCMGLDRFSWQLLTNCVLFVFFVCAQDRQSKIVPAVATRLSDVRDIVVA